MSSPNNNLESLGTLLHDFQTFCMAWERFLLRGPNSLSSTISANNSDTSSSTVCTCAICCYCSGCSSLPLVSKVKSLIWRPSLDSGTSLNRETICHSIWRNLPRRHLFLFLLWVSFVCEVRKTLEHYRKIYLFLHNHRSF